MGVCSKGYCCEVFVHLQDNEGRTALSLEEKYGPMWKYYEMSNVGLSLKLYRAKCYCPYS